jgi:hypothetical protein
MEGNIRIGGGNKLLGKDGSQKREDKSKGTEGLHWEQTSLLSAEGKRGARAALSAERPFRKCGIIDWLCFRPPLDPFLSLLHLSHPSKRGCRQKRHLLRRRNLSLVVLVTTSRLVSSVRSFF